MFLLQAILEALRAKDFQSATSLVARLGDLNLRAEASDYVFLRWSERARRRGFRDGAPNGPGAEQPGATRVCLQRAGPTARGAQGEGGSALGLAGSGGEDSTAPDIGGEGSRASASGRSMAPTGWGARLRGVRPHGEFASSAGDLGRDAGSQFSIQGQGHGDNHRPRRTGHHADARPHSQRAHGSGSGANAASPLSTGESSAAPSGPDRLRASPSGPSQGEESQARRTENSVTLLSRQRLSAADAVHSRD